MKKVININFQGLVIAIEESAYDILTSYIDSLRRYFANEEGREEIINDIERRIGELFMERLKAGATCITDEDVNSVIANMGRPEDFEAQGADVPPGAGSQPAGAQGSYQPGGKRSLFRNADDKILGGVCSGLANYLGIDPIIVRIAFVLLVGALFWVYILLWIIVPSRSIQSNITKRLFRNPDQKVIGGVAGGIAAYFNIDVWIPRLIFAFPFLIALISGSFHSLWWNWDFGFTPRIISDSFGWTLFLTYIILWIAVPVANTTSEKLEMRGEKVNLNSIASTVREDLEQFKVKAEKWGSEVKTSAQKFGQTSSAQFKNFGTEAATAARRSSSGIGHAIGVIIKAFFIFIFAIVALSFFGVFLGLIFGGLALQPLKGFVLEGGMQNILAWTAVVLIFMLPLVGLLTWGVRRLMGIRSRSHFVGISFVTLWIVGLVAGLILVSMVVRNFRRNVMLREEVVSISQPPGKLFIDVEKTDWKNYHRDFMGMDFDEDFPWYFKDKDSLLINTVRISMTKSNDSLYHVYCVKGSRGRTTQAATETAEKIAFSPAQMDSLLVFPRGFAISRNEKFRNQRVRVVVEVPAGRTIKFSERLSEYDWMDMRMDNRDEYDNWDVNNDLYTPTPGNEYLMEDDGRARVVN